MTTLKEKLLDNIGKYVNSYNDNVISQSSNFTNQLAEEFDIQNDTLLRYIQSKLNDQIGEVLHGDIDPTIESSVNRQFGKIINEYLDLLKQQQGTQNLSKDTSIHE